MRFRHLTILLLSTTSCAAPRPDLAIAPDVHAADWGIAIDRDASPIPPADFWAGFGSPIMSAAVDRAIAANPQLDIARARILAARGDLGIAAAALLPTIGATAGISGTRSDDLTAPTYSYKIGTAGLDIAYDIDLFGSARAGKRAARARARAAGFDARAAGLVVETDTARTLVTWAALGERISIAQRNIASAQEILRIVTVRRREGVATQLEVGLQSTELARLRAARSSLIEGQANTAGALATLMGVEAPSFETPPMRFADLAAPHIDPGQPGDLLFRRPDIQAAEARIAAAQGSVEQARAAFRPGLRLSGSALGQAAGFGGPFGLILTAGSSLVAPIFQGGRLRGALTNATAAQLESVASYRQTLLGALAEGNRALVSLAEARRRVGYLGDAVKVSQEASRLARLQYVEGDVDLTTLIDAERNETATADLYLLARQDVLTATIDLYKALGGTPTLANSHR